MNRSKVLVLLAHPVFQSSRGQRALLEGVRRLEDVTVHDLYEEYPNFHIDVAREQKLLVEHEIIVLQHPFFWYSSPALLKEWQDVVLEFGFAFGADGIALQGKRWWSVVTTGGDASTYSRDGRNFFTMRELLAPFEQTARLCRMEFLDPYVVHGVGSMSDHDLGLSAAKYRELMGLEQLRQPTRKRGIE